MTITSTMATTTLPVYAVRRAAGEVCIRRRTFASWLRSARGLRRRPLSPGREKATFFRCYNRLVPIVVLIVVPIVVPNRRSDHQFRSQLRRWSLVLNRASSDLETVIAKALQRAPASESALLAWPVACGSAVAERT